MTVKSSSEPLLSIRDLTVDFAVGATTVHAVRGVSLDVPLGQVVGVVGESGSGKSTIALALMGLLPQNASVTGSVRFEGRELLRSSGEVMRRLRGNRIAMVFQDPMTSLNPVLTIGRQIAEAVIVHQRISSKAAYARAHELLEMVAMPDAGQRLRSYPHELSGGMRQRVMIAIAMANEPELLVADEPTTALDVTIQAQILDMLKELGRHRNLSIILVTHDLGAVAGIADSVHVMYAGRPVEYGDVREIFYRPAHPYTIGLLACLPRLDTRVSDLEPIGGMPPLLTESPKGCSFAPRCPHAEERCRVEEPSLRTVGQTSAACHLAPVHERSVEALS